MQSPKAQKRKAHEYVERRLDGHDYDDLADVLRGAQRELPWAPSRSTFYQWVREWQGREAAVSDTAWTLATDVTGRPDVVMKLLAFAWAWSGGRIRRIGAARAQWAVRLATALPHFLAVPPAADSPAAMAQQELVQSPLSWLWVVAGEYAQAEAAGESTMELDLAHATSLAWLGWGLERRKEKDDAR